MVKNKSIKWLKRFSLFILIMLSIILLIPRVVEYKMYRSKENIKNLVIDNLEFLNQSIENENYDNLLEFEEVKDKQFWRNNSDGIIVEYFCKGYGIVPASLYTGFYNTSVDEPTGFQGDRYPLTKIKKGWEWKEPNGDNWYYTEKIAEHWYYYEAGF